MHPSAVFILGLLTGAFAIALPVILAMMMRLSMAVHVIAGGLMGIAFAGAVIARGIR